MTVKEYLPGDTILGEPPRCNYQIMYVCILYCTNKKETKYNWLRLRYLYKGGLIRLRGLYPFYRIVYLISSQWSVPLRRGRNSTCKIWLTNLPPLFGNSCSKPKACKNSFLLIINLPQVTQTSTLPMITTIWAISTRRTSMTRIASFTIGATCSTSTSRRTENTRSWWQKPTPVIHMQLLLNPHQTLATTAMTHYWYIHIQCLVLTTLILRRALLRAWSLV